MGLAASPYLCSLPADLPALWRIADDYRVVTDAGPIQRIRRFTFLLPLGCPGHTVPGVPVRQEKGPPDLFLIPAHPQTPGEPTQRCRCRSGMDTAGQYRDVCPPPQPVVPARAPPHGKADLDQRPAYDSTLAPPAPDYEFDQTVVGHSFFYLLVHGPGPARGRLLVGHRMIATTAAPPLPEGQGSPHSQTLQSARALKPLPKSTGMLNPGEESVEQWRWISYPYVKYQEA
jgi:hypothetical protein